MIASLCCAACASPYRRVSLGTGHAATSTAGGPTAPTAVRVDNPGDLHEVELHVSMPRAVELDYQLTCPGVIRHGVIGETWDNYRRRRLAQLQSQRRAKTNAVAAVAGAVVGDVGAQATVNTPGGQGTVDAHADGAAVGGLVAEQIVPEAQLDPSDSGAQTSRRKLTLRPRSAGACTLRLSHRHQPDDLNAVHGTFSVTRLANRKNEKWAAERRASAQATKVRASLRASLIARGADPTKRIRERAALKARIDADRRQRLIVKLRADRLRRETQNRRARRLQLEANLSFATRGRIVRWLGECGGDPHKRARERAAIARQREATRIARLHARRLRDSQRRKRYAQRNALVAVALDLRGQLRGQLIDAGADPEYRWKLYQARDAARATAPARPVMPATPVEVRPAAPYDGAIWIAGSFAWRGLRWVWQPGRWSSGAVVRDHRPRPPRAHRPPAPRVRDHRTATPHKSRVRDHRTATPPTSHVRDHRTATPPASRVRDHRPPRGSHPRIRDHRTSDGHAKKKPNKSRTRDHR